MAVEVAATRRRFTRREYHRMAEVSILGKHDRVELIKGEIVEMSPTGCRDKAFVANLAQLLIMRLSGRVIVWVQTGIVLADDTEPEPDISILRQRAVPYKDREADAEDVFVLIEMADSSLAYDRSTKMRLYAEASIPEYWIVDCDAETVEIYRDPRPQGYRDVNRIAGSTTLTLDVFPDVTLTTAEIFA